MNCTFLPISFASFIIEYSVRVKALSLLEYFASLVIVPNRFKPVFKNMNIQKWTLLILALYIVPRASRLYSLHAGIVRSILPVRHECPIDSSPASSLLPTVCTTGTSLEQYQCEMHDCDLMSYYFTLVRLPIFTLPVHQPSFLPLRRAASSSFLS
jgi:hypothetical protein